LKIITCLAPFRAATFLGTHPAVGSRPSERCSPVAMAPGRKICTALLVDVSPSMHPHLGWVGDHLSRVVQNRVLHAKIDEFALVTCGSRETNNDVHTEGLENATAAGETDYEQEYLNVSVDAPMSCAAPELAEAVADLPSLAGEGAVADYLDALTVASDVLVRHERGGAFQRRILFVTDLRTPCAVDEDFLDGMAAGMRGASVQLVVAVASSSGDDDAVRANRAMLERLCAKLNAPGADGSIVPAARRSEVSAAHGALLAAQVKQIKPTTTFRGDLQFTPWMTLKVWAYKKVSEQKPPPMKLYNDLATDAEGDGPMVTRERTFTSYADPDNPDDVAPEMMIQAYPYGPANIPVQEDVKALMASKYDKGMKIFGFTPLETVPQWYGMEEARILVPWPTREGAAAAGMAASAGLSDRDAGKAAAAMSALARAMQRKGVAALTRAVWMQGSDKVSFGALTPHVVPEGDFLLFVPLPYAEDAHASDFKPLPIPGSAAAARLTANAAAKLVPTEEQCVAADALVDALSGAGPEPWERLNPALTRMHALIHARAVDELAAPLAASSGGGPDAAAAIDGPPLATAAAAPGDASNAVEAKAKAAEAAKAFTSACGGLKMVEARGVKRRGADRALPPREDAGASARGEDRAEEEENRAAEEKGSTAVAEHPAAEDRPARVEPAAEPTTTVTPSSEGDGWVVVKEEMTDTMEMDTLRMDTLAPDNGEEQRGDDPAAAQPPPVEDDGFFDDME